jgi:hypothetical protein
MQYFRYLSRRRRPPFAPNSLDKPLHMQQVRDLFSVLAMKSLTGAIATVTNSYSTASTVGTTVTTTVCPYTLSLIFYGILT